MWIAIRGLYRVGIIVPPHCKKSCVMIMISLDIIGASNKVRTKSVDVCFSYNKCSETAAISVLLIERPLKID